MLLEIMKGTCVELCSLFRLKLLIFQLNIIFIFFLAIFRMGVHLNNFLYGQKLLDVFVRVSSLKVSDAFEFREVRAARIVEGGVLLFLKKNIVLGYVMTHC